MYILNKKWFQNSLILFITVWAGFLYLHPYWIALSDGWSKYIVLCGDFGLYLGEAQKYMKEWANLVDAVNVNHEPTLYLMMSTLARVTGVQLGITLIVMAFFVHILGILWVYIGTRRWSNNNSIATITTLLISSLYLYNTTFTYLTTRQNLSNSFLILCSITPIFISKGKYNNYIVGGILMAGAITSHRVWLLFSWCALIISLIYALIKKDRNIAKNIWIVIFTLILAAWPYIILDSGNTLYTIKWYYERIMWTQSLIEQGLSFSNNKDTISGWSFFSRSQITPELPIIHYFIYQPFIIILWISLIGKIRSKKFITNNNYLFLSFLLPLTIYTWTRLIFWIRVLWTFEIFFILLIWILIKNYTVGVRIITNILIIFLWIITLMPRSVILPRVYNVSTDASINFIKNNIKIENTYLVGPYCVADLWVQLWYTTSHTLTNSPVWKHKEREADGELHSFIIGNMTDTLMRSIQEKPYLHELFRDKELYILYLPSANKEDVTLFRKNQHPYNYSSYVTMKYSDKTQKSYVEYILKINRDTMIYFDSVNYLIKNLR